MNNSRSLWLVSLLLVATVASYGRLETATKRPLWLDEHFTRQISTLPSLGDVYKSSVLDFNGDTPVLYPAASWVLYRWLSPRWAVRLTSIVSGVAAVVLLALVGRVLFGRRTGLIAGSLLALCVYHINYSQDGRAYALLGCGATAQFYFLVCYLGKGRARDVVGWGLSAMVSLYAHHFSMIYVVCGLAVAAITLVANAMRRGAARDAQANPAAPPQNASGTDTGAADSLPGSAMPDGAAGTVLSRMVAPVVVLLAMAALYAPGLKTFIAFASRPRIGEPHTLNLSVKFFSELIGRWGNGSQWSVIYAIFLALGVWSVLYRRGLTLACLLWLAAPFALFGFVPFTKFFDIRYLIGSLPVFILLVAEGIAVVSRIGAPLGRKSGASGRIAGKIRYADLPSLAVFGFLLCLSVSTYIDFRQTATRCSSFFEAPELMDIDDGFCGKHLILNSLHGPHSFLLKPTATSDKRRDP